MAAERSARPTTEEARDGRAFFSAFPKATLVKAYEIALMAAIVTTLVYIPVGALVAVLAFAAFDVPLYSLLSFGGHIHIVAGLALWWGTAFLPALVYAAVCVMS